MSRHPYVQLGTAMSIDPREDKLPAWARATLSTLRGSIGDYDEQLRDHRDSQEPSQVYWERVSINQNPIYIPERADVVFDFGGKLAHQDQLKFRWAGENVQVMGGRPLDIKPQASNTIELRLRSGY